MHLQYKLLGRVRWENFLSSGDRGCSEPRLHHSIPAWATEQDSVSKKKKKKKERKKLAWAQWLTPVISAL